ncbi:hypothetical protein Tco_0373625 [Tanacetum coccineum]
MCLLNIPQRRASDLEYKFVLVFVEAAKHQILGGDQLLVILCGFGTKSLEFGISFLFMTISGAARVEVGDKVMLEVSSWKDEVHFGKKEFKSRDEICLRRGYYDNCALSRGSYDLSWKPCQGDSLNLPDHRYKRQCCSLIPTESDALPHAYAQTTKSYYKHQYSRIKKAQEFKTKTFANSDKQDLPLRYQVYQGRLLAIFQDDVKYEHVGQDTRSQGGKDDKYKQGNDLKISEQKKKSKDNDKGSRSKITGHEATNLQ